MNTHIAPFANPFRPGAGHPPPHLAGRIAEQTEFRQLLGQSTILENLILTGLRGVGKTVLLDSFKPLAQQEGWGWVGTDISESTSVKEANIATRLLADLAITTSSYVLGTSAQFDMGFSGTPTQREHRITFDVLENMFDETPGLISDKLKAVLKFVWENTPDSMRRGIIFAYDEAQNLSDHAEKEEYPLSLLLEVFQSIQRQGIPYMLALVGLPTLFPKLVEARTYSERMFHVVFLDKLNREDCRDAIITPIEDQHCPIRFTDKSVETISNLSDGYPYFIQFICREVYDVWIGPAEMGDEFERSVPSSEIIQKLDADFFSGRWASATDRQRELLAVIAHLEDCETEFTVQNISKRSNDLLNKSFSGSQVGQLLKKLSDQGLVYKNRHGKYAFAVPLLDRFIRRQHPLESMGSLFEAV